MRSTGTILVLTCAVLLTVSRSGAEQTKYAGLSPEDLRKQFEEMTEKGWTPVSIRGKASGRASVFDITWDSERVGAWVLWKGPASEVDAKGAELKARGMKLLQESRWQAGGAERAAGIWVRPSEPGRRVARFGGKSFAEARGGRWEERVEGKVVRSFHELNRTAEYVELATTGQDHVIRIYSDYYEVRPAEKKVFVREKVSGGWSAGDSAVVVESKGERRYPRLHRSLARLKEARADLKEATDRKWGGHLVKALAALDSAIDETERAVKASGDLRAVTGEPRDPVTRKYADFPQVRHALDEVTEAAAELKKLPLELEGHRAKAVEYLETAAHQLNACIAFATKDK